MARVHHKTLGIVGMGVSGWRWRNGERTLSYHAGSLSRRRRHQRRKTGFNAPAAAIWMRLLQEADFCLRDPAANGRNATSVWRNTVCPSEIVRHFINAGRSPVVDENALIAALQNGSICGRSGCL
ncbi:hypothetical protein KCP70_10250 [Salmonella enterica subsp. enterica]|nr:hypothetical protein KCP70_10250 [Salmonella enterica subsp. enterica]